MQQKWCIKKDATKKDAMTEDSTKKDATKKADTELRTPFFMFAGFFYHCRLFQNLQ